jgi:serine phosphatase RsbU (regulator of sigma subunit)
VALDAGPPLCVLEDYPYVAAETTLAPGDILVLISDGITEAHNSRLELYGRERVIDCLGGIDASGRSAEKICQGIFADVRGFADGAGQSDDITVMAVGFRPFSLLRK